MARTNKYRSLIIGALVAIAGSGTAHSVERGDFGKREYTSNCAICHGAAGKGDGPYAGIVDKRIADISVLARNNQGVFPFQKTYETIDGRIAVREHGPRPMPIWGDRYLAAAGEYYFDVPYEPEMAVRSRILALTEYVARLQVR
jgi:mono/diheme cytochrome c family protein